MKTAAEINHLKRNWAYDPCWDIEDTEGFEDHRAELVAFREQREAEWAEQMNAQVTEKANALQCSKALAVYIIFLERDLAELKEKVSN